MSSVVVMGVGVVMAWVPVFAIPFIEKIYRMLNSTIGRWLCKFRARFGWERCRFEEQVGEFLKLAVRLVHLEYNVCSAIRKN